MLAGKVAMASFWIKDGAPVLGLHRLCGDGRGGVQAPSGHGDCGHPGRGTETRPGLRVWRKQDWGGGRGERGQDGGTMVLNWWAWGWLQLR